MNMKTMLDVEIEERINKLANMELGTKEYNDAADGIATLMDRRLKIEELEMTELKNEKQASEERKSRLWKTIIDAGLGIAGIGVTIWGAKASFKFEETGTITTQAGKKFIDKLFFRK